MEKFQKNTKGYHVFKTHLGCIIDAYLVFAIKQSLSRILKMDLCIYLLLDGVISNTCFEDAPGLTMYIHRSPLGRGVFI